MSINLDKTKEELKSQMNIAKRVLSDAYDSWTASFVLERDSYLKWAESREVARRATAALIEYEMTLHMHENLNVDKPTDTLNRSCDAVLQSGNHESDQPVQVNQENEAG